MRRWLLAAATLCAPAALVAQGVPRTQVRCNGQIVTSIAIQPLPPSLGGVFARLPMLGQTARALQTTTDPEVIRRLVLLEQGKPCSALRRYETERRLRAQPFLSQASVTAYPDPSGTGVQIEVVTVDEVSTVASLRLTGDDPYLSAVRLGSANVGGRGVYAVGEWREGAFYRDAWSGRLTDYQAFGRPYQLTLRGARRRFGGEWAAELVERFFSDVQRAAWRVQTGEQHVYVPFARPGSHSTSLGVRRSFADVGGMLRIGEPGRLSLFGVSFSREEEQPDTLPVLVTERGLRADSNHALAARYAYRRSARVNALWGVRNIEYLRVHGFDALTAEQDIARGFHLGTVFGRSLAVLGSRDDDIFLSVNAYAGAGTPWSFAAAEVRGEGRQSYKENRWDDILGSARAAWYVKFTERHTATTSIEWSGGWRQRSPFQLTLGERYGGLRGYRASRLPGGERGIVRHDERLVLGDVNGAADVGVALFGEAGRMWAGDVPYGVTTPVRYSVGASLLAAIPPRSKRHWRLDVAFPVSRDAGRSVEFRLTREDRTRSFWQEPDDVRRSRSRTLPTSIFSWP